MTQMDFSLTQAAGSKTRPWGKERAFSDNDVVSLRSPHFTSPVEFSSDVLFCSVSDPVKSCDAGSKSGAFEKSSECIVNGSQAANGKRKSAFLLQITKAESRENSLSWPSSRSSPLDLSKLILTFEIKLIQTPESFRLWREGSGTDLVSAVC